MFKGVWPRRQSAPSVEDNNNTATTKSNHPTNSSPPSPSTKELSTSANYLNKAAASGDNPVSGSKDSEECSLKRKFEQDDLDSIKSPGRLARKRIRDAKHRARSELVPGDLFCMQRYYSLFDLEQFKTNFTNSLDKLPPEVTKEMLESRPYVIERVDGRTLTEKEFIERYEKPKIPVVFTHLIDDWPGFKENNKWSSLAWLDRKFRNQKFKCGEDDSGCSVKIKMKYYLQYMKQTLDDSPLYVFDSNYGEHSKRRKLLKDYSVPHLFREDLFQHAGESKRPPYRWFVMGPPRSGTGIHIDPLATSAWNSLIRGAKRWCLLPNDVPKHLIKPLQTDNCAKQKDEAVTWFRYVHPRVTSPTWPAKWRPIEFVQLPGETVFVPGGWWHVVLNLDISVAMTQNYCNTGNFRHVWLKTARGRPRFGHKWYRALKKLGRHDLIAMAHEVSKNNPEHIPNTEVDLSSSDSSSDTSSASSDDSAASFEVVEPEKPATNSKSSSSSSSSSQETPVTAKDEISAPKEGASGTPPAVGSNSNVNSANDMSSSDTSDDDSGVEEQDKKRRKIGQSS